MGDSLTIRRQSDKIVTLDIRLIRDREPANEAPAELALPEGRDTGGDLSRARRVYPEGCILIHPSEVRQYPPRAGRSAPALQRRQQGILPTRGNGSARAVSAYRRTDGRSGAAALVSQPAENTGAPLTLDGASDRDRIAQAVEREIERLRKLRPELDSRIDRAASILVMQLSSRPRSRPVRVRISKNGTARFLVNSATVGGGVYVVDPKSWECNCPDAHRRSEKGCKHSITCYVLERVARVLRKGCSACHGGWVYIGEGIVDPQSGEVAEAINPVRCRRCGGGLSHDFVQRWLESQRWHDARSRADNPHSYCLRREAGD